MSSSSKQQFKMDKPPIVRETYQQNRLHLLSIFPEELWRLVLGKVDDPDVLLKLSESGAYLYELLLPQWSKFLFHAAWKVMADKMDYKCEWGEEHRAVRNEKLNEVVKLRLVCHSWLKAVDNYYQHHPLHFRLDQHKNQFTSRSYITNASDLGHTYIADEEEQRIESFFELFDSTYLATGRNPFFGRSLTIRLNFEESNRCQRILELYGQHVWYCQLYIYTVLYSATVGYFRIRATLDKLPNLKKLHIMFYKYDNPAPHITCQLHLNRPEVWSNPQPKLDGLQMLSVDSILRPMYRELLSRNSHVSMLATHHNWTSVDEYIYNVPLPNLRKLSAYFNLVDNFLKMDDPSVNWPLISELHLHLDWTNDLITWQKVFDVLSDRFERKLVKLSLKLPRVDSKKERKQLLIPSCKLHLLCLTHLQLNMPNLACLDLLLPLKGSLQVLQLEVHLAKFKQVENKMKKMETGKKAIIKFFSCGMSATNTNMWTIFTKLKIFHFHFCSNESATEILTASENSGVTRIRWRFNREECQWKVKTLENQKQ